MPRENLPPPLAVPLALFTAGIVAVASAGYAVARVAGLPTDAWGGAAACLAWSPGLAGLAVGWWLRLDRRTDFGLRASQKRFYVLAVLLPAGVAGVVYGACWLSGLAAFSGRWDRPSFGSVSGVGTAALAALLGIVGTIGEEVGWRGFLVPLLARRFALPGVVWVSWFFWFAYHVPIIFWTDYHGSAPWPQQLACFGTMLFSLNVLLAWIRLRSGSVWPAVVLHAAHNVLIQNVFDPLTARTVGYVTGEFGAGLAAAYLPVAFLFLVHGVRQGLAPTGASPLRSEG